MTDTPEEANYKANKRKDEGAGEDGWCQGGEAHDDVRERASIDANKWRPDDYFVLDDHGNRLDSFTDRHQILQQLAKNTRNGGRF